MPRDDLIVFRREAFDLVGYFNELFYVGEYELLRRIEEKKKWSCSFALYLRTPEAETII